MTTLATEAKPRELPWEGIGKGFLDTGKKYTAAQAIKEAGLDWDVELRKVYTQNDKGNKVLIPGNFAVCREDNDQVLGLVKSRYKQFQNREAFAFADNLVDSGAANYVAAGPLRNGRVVFLVMKVPTEIMIGGEDRHDLYILFRTSHDGTKAVSAYVTTIRFACTNTVPVITRETGHLQRWSMPHTSTLEGKLQEARETLQLTFQYAEEFTKIGNELLEIKLPDDKAVKMLQTILPNRPKTEERIDEIMECIRTSDKNGYHGTGWGLVNGLVEYYEHYRTGTQKEATFHNTIDGQINIWRNRATQMLLASA